MSYVAPRTEVTDMLDLLPPDVAEEILQPRNVFGIPDSSAQADDTTYSLLLEIVDEDGQPVQAGQYRIRLPDGRTDEGQLDSSGQLQFADLADAGESELELAEVRLA